MIFKWIKQTSLKTQNCKDFLFRHEKVKEFNNQLKKGVPIDELLKNYENHRSKNKENLELRSKGWSEIAKKYEKNYDPTCEWNLNRAFGDKYNMHNTEEVIDSTPYWDTKENDAYWSLSKWQRLKLYLNEKVISQHRYFIKEYLFLNLIIFSLLIYYANKKSKQFII